MEKERARTLDSLLDLKYTTYERDPTCGAPYGFVVFGLTLQFLGEEFKKEFNTLADREKFIQMIDAEQALRKSYSQEPD